MQQSDQKAQQTFQVQKPQIQSASSKEYQSDAHYTNPLIKKIRQACIEMDIGIEEGTAYIYEDDIDKALATIQNALVVLQVALVNLKKLIEMQQIKVEKEVNLIQAQNIFSAENLNQYKQATVKNQQQQNQAEQQFLQLQNDLKSKIISLSVAKDTPEQYKLLHYKRYQAKLTLQSCAIKSQLEQHDKALIGARQGLKTCIQVFNCSYIMCKSEIQQTIGIENIDPQNKSSNKPKAKSMVTNNNLNQTKLKESQYQYQSKQKSKTPQKEQQKKQSYKRADNGSKISQRRQSHDPKPVKLLLRNHNLRKTSSPDPSIIQGDNSKFYRKGGSNTSHSPYSAYSYHSNGSDSPKNRILKPKMQKLGLGSRKSSIKSTLKFHLSGSEDEQSLERIHTFNLKNDLKLADILSAKKRENAQNQNKENEDIGDDKISPQKIKQLMLYKELGPALTKISDEKQMSLNSPTNQDPLLQSISTRDQFTSPKLNKNIMTTEDRIKKKKSRQTVGPINCYVEEQARVLDSFMYDSYQIFKSLIKRLNHFLLFTQSKQPENFQEFEDNCVLKQFLEVKKSFKSNQSQKNLKFVKNFASQQHVDALRKNDKYKYAGRNVLGVRQIDDWINSLEIGHVMQLNPMTAQELTQTINKHHEFQKDPMLEKLVLLVVAFFSIGTEMRLVVQEDKSKDLFKQSELWHAQSVFFGSYYIPSQCPLVTHVINSYFKHYADSQESKIESLQIPNNHEGQDTKRQRDQQGKVKQSKTILQKYLIKQIVHNQKDGKSSPKYNNLITTISDERRGSGQGLKIKRDLSQRETRKKSKTKVVKLQRVSKERSKSPATYTLSQENKSITKKRQPTPEKKKTINQNSSKINLLKGFLTNTIQKDQLNCSNKKSAKKSKYNMFDGSIGKNSSTNNQEIISINVPVNLEHLSYRYDASQNHDYTNSCKNQTQRKFLFVPEELSEITSDRDYERFRFDLPMQTNKRVTMLKNIQSQSDLNFYNNNHLSSSTQRRASLNSTQKKLIVSKITQQRTKTPSRNSLQKTNSAKVGIQLASRQGINEILEKQRVKQLQTFTRLQQNTNHQSRFINGQDTLMSRDMINQVGSTERFQNSKTIQANINQMNSPLSNTNHQYPNCYIIASHGNIQPLKASNKKRKKDPKIYGNGNIALNAADKKNKTDLRKYINI
ncbi:UNKNOWN [Stylonychia lemnae]|uniref:Uncharacterized protein n=1 Tax=Stylonychia lemnae TaxID=5949 RepID=A0A078AGB9_STYLE|nr:UNKNOWN [Stylonychia lemnae]|eukprot:CDW80567.1 UNKNOWN [Stylonychia lemnae]